MKLFFYATLVLLLTVSYSFAQTSSDTICILQLNDVYEIGPLSGGRVGGMARVATIVKQHDARYKTVVVMAGDFVSPSVIGTTKIEGQRVYGKHMVDIMNKAGVDLVTFGNHEFDIPEADLQQRMNESKFTWVSSDVSHKNTNGIIAPFYKTAPDSLITPVYYQVSSAQRQFNIGIVTATIQNNKQPWVVYHDNIGSMKKAWKQVRKHSDVVIALTHLTLAEDEKVLRKLKRIPLVMGGHEHQNIYHPVRKGVISKADANAKTMYRHLLFRDGKRGKIKILSELLNVDTEVVPDPEVEVAVKEWEDKAYASFRAIGLEPDAIVYHTDEPLDGTEASVRNKQTNLGTLVASAMLSASPQADIAMFNSGSIRIDDKIEGVLTQLDVIRTLPFGGKLCEVDITGELLKTTLNTSNALRGQGGYLQVSNNLAFNNGKWSINGMGIEDAKIYKIISPEFLFSGVEKGLDFLQEGTTGIKLIKRFDAPGDIHTDLRLAVVKYLQKIDTL